MCLLHWVAYNYGYSLKWPVAFSMACYEYLEAGRGTRPYKLKSAMEILLLASIDIGLVLWYCGFIILEVILLSKVETTQMSFRLPVSVLEQLDESM